MKLLDLYCGAGGAAYGYFLAGFDDITGVDIAPQKRYPFHFVQADALDFLSQLIKTGEIKQYDLIHASPPCLFGTSVQHLGKARNGSYPKHNNLIPQIRILIKLSGKPYAIENVSGARKHLINPIMLCGVSFGLKVYRHRYFEVSPWFLAPSHVSHRDQTPTVGNGISPKGFISVCGSGGIRGMNSQEILKYWSYAMNINWMTRKELAQAIPPAYTKWIGEQMLSFILEK